MNYRHAFHAGNHCDVLKHACLAIVLERLKEKEKPFGVLDTHAGKGLYDLGGDEARRAGEHLGGIVRVIDDAAAPAALAPYLDAVRRQNPFGGLRWYPGSPVIVQGALRAGDSAKFCELHWQEREALEGALAGPKGRDPRIRVYERDGYEAVRAFLPPTERRGLVLIDPPFEKPGEFDRLGEALAGGMKRFANGVFAVWRPIKDGAAFSGFAAAIDALSLPKILEARLEIMAPAEGKLTGSAMHVVNPPFGLGAALGEILPYLAARLAVGAGARWSLTEREAGATIIDAGGAA